MTYPEKLIQILSAEVGYLGKKSNKDLDDKTANAGGNYNKFARDLDAMSFYNGKKNSFDWCDVFCDWGYVKTVGMDYALEITGQPKGGYGAGCGYSMRYFKQIGQLHTDNPQIGDQAFFSKDGGNTIYHTGIVSKVSDYYIWVIEGNSINVDPARPNVYGVGENKYAKTNKYLYAFGTPKWELVPVPDETEMGQMPYYRTYADVPDCYKPYIEVLLRNGSLKGSEDPDTSRIDDNVINVSEDFCRIMTVLGRNGLIK